jgi:hypothetical protein
MCLLDISVILWSLEIIYFANIKYIENLGVELKVSREVSFSLNYIQ